MTTHNSPPFDERRQEPRHGARLEVDCTSGDTFLYAHVANMSSLGIFVCTPDLKPVGTILRLGFAPRPPINERIELEGEVMWVTKKHETSGQPGMGVRFINVAEDTRQQLLELVRAIAYLDDESGEPE